MWSRSGSTGTARSVTVVAVPSSARSRVRGESRLRPRNTAQVSSVAQIAPDRMPSLASASSVPLKASEAISSATVNPIPATAPTPTTAPQPTGRRQPPLGHPATSHAAPAVPIGLPTM